jgi:hypothetical protein
MPMNVITIVERKENLNNTNKDDYQREKER